MREFLFSFSSISRAMRVIINFLPYCVFVVNILTSARYTIIRYLGEMVFSNIFSCLSKQGKTRLAVGKVVCAIDDVRCL